MRLESLYHRHSLLSVFARFLAGFCKLCNKLNPISDGWGGGEGGGFWDGDTGHTKMRLFKYFGSVRNNSETCDRQEASNYDILEFRALLRFVISVNRDRGI